MEPDDRDTRRGAFLTGPDGPRLLLVGGGAEPVRLFAADDTSALWRQVPAPGLPATLYGAILAAGDLNGDGLTDLVLGNAPPDRRDERTAHDAGGDPADKAPPEAGDTVNAWLATPDGTFERRPPGIPGPATAALLVDLDGDGRTELLLAGSPPASEDDPDVVRVYRWAREGLGAIPVRVPGVEDPVSDLALLRSGGGVEILLATGGLAPDARPPDRLWRWQQDRLVDVSEELGEPRLGSTFRALPRPDGALRLLRGGLVPGDPRRELVLPPTPSPVSGGSF